MAHAEEQGGLSGTPVFAKSTSVVRRLCAKSNNAFPVIGVGGIDSLATAKEKISAGASLIQVYTGFIYQGPGLITRITKGLAEKDQP
jgi:dihydroorotate dehydrogenase